MKTCNKARLSALLIFVFCAGGCARDVYRESYNWSAPFQAYVQYSVLKAHPFDDVDPPSDDTVLQAALSDEFERRKYDLDQREETRAEQIVVVLNYDIEAGRRRVQSLAVNQARFWTYQLSRVNQSERLIGLEIYARQTGNLIYRSEAFRRDAPSETIGALLSRYPPKTRRFQRGAI
ncbi:MAG: hypothetical protein AAF862_09975 [Pseudomonadota bacterium]